MKKILYALFVSSLTVNSSSTKAEGSGSATAIVVDQITVLNGNLYLWSNQFLNPDSCSTASVVVVPANTPRWEAFYSTALTSVTTGKPTTLWFSGCSTGSPWWSTVPTVVLISIQK